MVATYPLEIISTSTVISQARWLQQKIYESINCRVIGVYDLAIGGNYLHMICIVLTNIL